MATPNLGVTVQGGAGVGRGPDGRAVVMVVLASGLGQFQVPIAADQAEKFADDLRDAIYQAATEAQRANSPIILATPDVVPDLGALLSGKLAR